MTQGKKSERSLKEAGKKTKAFEPINIGNIAEWKDFAAKVRGDPKLVADLLKRHERWRQGIGEYEFNEDPKKNLPPPMSANALTIVIDAAIQMIEGAEEIYSYHRENK